jgi:hypothetical protein
MTFSQYEEDKILQELIYNLPPTIREKYNCLFDLGAADGLTNSNIAQLILSNPINYFEAIFLIEIDGVLLRNAKRSYKDFNNIKFIEKEITRENVVELIKELELGLYNFLIVNVDIDGDDLEIVKKLITLDSLIIIIEYNPTLGINIKYENPRGKHHGSSFLSIKEFMEKNQYSLIGSTKSNLIFGKSYVNEYWKKDCNFFNHSFFHIGFGYNGDMIHLNSDNKSINENNNSLFILPWNNLLYKNFVPKYLRFYPVPVYISRIYNLIFLLFNPFKVLDQIRVRRSRSKCT